MNSKWDVMKSNTNALARPLHIHSTWASQVSLLEQFPVELGYSLMKSALFITC